MSPFDRKQRNLKARNKRQNQAKQTKLRLRVEPLEPNDTYLKRLQDAPKGAQTMIIDVFRGGTPGGPFTITVTVDGDPTTYTNVQRGSNDEASYHLIYLQSHWGSGVKFTNFKVTKL